MSSGFRHHFSDTWISCSGRGQKCSYIFQALSFKFTPSERSKRQTTIQTLGFSYRPVELKEDNGVNHPSIHSLLHPMLLGENASLRRCNITLYGQHDTQVDSCALFLRARKPLSALKNVEKLYLEYTTSLVSKTSIAHTPPRLDQIPSESQSGREVVIGFRTWCGTSGLP
ncbi:hypothetical protein CC1G_07762 [Coprinopsis cinerea okayama7|uniref:Uncharacterized protein n=1 Tax=Coprinopsis cinerea (strain Okayama-7 / 130 / ATCC MYA-4618 / FGSC 9003) TaxID=240176 RepID=A8NNX8_COPC7|nr:hypothetical protein CC1G_07762 [Coprinopsis cinerea okayama7\|eukprot:XP_001835219.2 hypothetical protein CC1G_07762 [Coprinopsis cinerea okayama7\